MSSYLNLIPIRCCKDKSKALIFNEDLDEFIGEVSYPSVIFGNIYNELLTTGLSYLTEQSYVWRHEMPDNLWFYGKLYEMQLSFYENGSSAKESSAEFTKYFESQDVHSDEKEFYRIDYETEYQKGEHFPFIDNNEFWRESEYLENHWHVPVMVKTDTDEQDFETESSMQGTYLKTTLRYKSMLDFYIKNVMTFYRISKS
jgi:hypothetical protein